MVADAEALVGDAAAAVDSAEAAAEEASAEVVVEALAAAEVADAGASVVAEAAAAATEAVAEVGAASEGDAEDDSLHVVFRQWLCAFRVKEFVFLSIVNVDREELYERIGYFYYKCNLDMSVDFD